MNYSVIFQSNSPQFLMNFFNNFYSTEIFSALAFHPKLANSNSSEKNRNEIFFSNSSAHKINSYYQNKKFYIELFFSNPIDSIEVISTLTDNANTYPISTFICIDNNLFINLNELNLENFIKYLYERFPC